MKVLNVYNHEFERISHVRAHKVVNLDCLMIDYLFYVEQILAVPQWWRVADVPRVIQVCPARDVLKDTYVSLTVVEDLT